MQKRFAKSTAKYRWGKEKLISSCSEENLLVKNISVFFGKRPPKLGADRRKNGRISHGFFFLRSGQSRFFDDDGKSFCVKAGELAYLPRGYKYAMRYESEVNDFVLVNFDFENFSDFLFYDAGVVTKENERVAGVINEFEQNGSSEHPLAVFKRKELFYKLLGLLYELSNAQTASKTSYSQIRAGEYLLGQTYLENLPISQYASASNLSVSEFRTIFRKKYGTSPVKYRNNLRIERAKSLLKSGEYTVSEVCYLCGFDNLGYFCRHYKKATGEIPSSTQKNNQ